MFQVDALCTQRALLRLNANNSVNCKSLLTTIRKDGGFRFEHGQAQIYAAFTPLACQSGGCTAYQASQFTRIKELTHDVRATHEFLIDVQLGYCRPRRIGLDAFAN